MENRKHLLRGYGCLFIAERPEGIEHLDPKSMEVIQAQLERSLSGMEAGPVQFERHGYFIADRGGFNRTVTLRDSWTATR